MDSACGLSGYRESLTDSAARPTDAIGSALRRFGIGDVVDAGSPVEASYRLRAREPRLAVVLGGPILTDSAPRSEAERFIANRTAAKRTVAALRSEGAAILNVRTSNTEFLREIAAEAGELRIALRGAVCATGLTGSNVVLMGAHWLSGTAPARGDILASLGELDEGSVIEQARNMARRGLAVTSGLLSLRRTALPREAMDSRHLDELIPILPHTRHLIQMKQLGGYLSGRRQLAEYTGIREPSPVQRRVIERGWRVLLDAVREFVQSGGLLLPASHGPGFGIVPGFALREEVTLLAHTLESATDAISLATGKARAFFGLETSGWVESNVKGPRDRDFILSLDHAP
ncbi:hypothetical protein [uncultured Leifsonia sp.]|uniref:hypothetical protein n=1 Tax=uncultured Leifsonia sp. TaxID=340359 RepID=UPI0028D71AA5|nr:hypothetical protein [uncultured Leifsonia sp.]